MPGEKEIKPAMEWCKVCILGGIKIINARDVNEN